MKGIAGRVHVITGGYGGIATATARELAANGGIVVLTGRDADTGKKRAREIEHDTGGSVHFYELDVASSAAVDDVAERISQEVGPVHGLVINAAVAKVAGPLDHSDDDWRDVMATNLDGAFYCARAFAKRMLGIGGSIVFISSIGARTSVGPHIAYSASKAAVSHMARVLGVEWAPQGVRVNAVEPGHTATQAIEHLQRDAPAIAAQLEGSIPLGRFLHPAEIGQVIQFLISDHASAIVGAVVVADGGFSAR